MKPVLVGIALCFALAGCTEAIVMRNAQTGESFDCGSRYNYGIGAIVANSREESCVNDYRLQGWLRAPK
jgi:hypothetical protein